LLKKGRPQGLKPIWTSGAQRGAEAPLFHGRGGKQKAWSQRWKRCADQKL